MKYSPMNLTPDLDLLADAIELIIAAESAPTRLHLLAEVAVRMPRLDAPRDLQVAQSDYSSKHTPTKERHQNHQESLLRDIRNEDKSAIVDMKETHDTDLGMKKSPVSSADIASKEVFSDTKKRFPQNSHPTTSKSLPLSSYEERKGSLHAYDSSPRCQGSVHGRSIPPFPSTHQIDMRQRAIRIAAMLRDTKSTRPQQDVVPRS